MKALTIKQPWASLIVNGIKDIENRTCKTSFRGKILIHGGLSSAGKLCDVLSDTQKISVLNNNPSFSEKQLTYGAIIGSVEIINCVINHPSVWAEKTPNCINGGCSKCTNFTGECPETGISFNDKQKPIYNCILANPVLFDEPIPAKGKL